MRGKGGTARLWDAVTGENLRDFIGHTDVINYGAAFSPDGKYIVTGSWDTTVRLWDAETGKEIRQFVGDKCRQRCSVFPRWQVSLDCWG